MDTQGEYGDGGEWRRLRGVNCGRMFGVLFLFLLLFVLVFFSTDSWHVFWHDWGQSCRWGRIMW